MIRFQEIDFSKGFFAQCRTVLWEKVGRSFCASADIKN